MIGRGKDKGATGASGEQSWRELAGSQVRRRINTPQARKRRMRKTLKMCGVILVLAVVVACMVFGFDALRSQGKKIEIAPPSKPIERVLFNTDGVLPDSWLGSVVRLTKGMSLMEADIYGMKSALEAEGQVRSASVERVFPNTLKIEIQEHLPILRMAVAGEAGERELRIVSMDGTIYTGVGYSKMSLLKMPFLRPYQHPGGHWQPLNGIMHVGALLELCRQGYPQEFSQWQLVSLEDYTGNLDMPGEVIEVTAVAHSGAEAEPKRTRIVFSASIDFAVQLDRLRHIREIAESIGDPLLSIDLSLRGSAAVQFESGRTSLY